MENKPPHQHQGRFFANQSLTNMNDEKFKLATDLRLVMQHCENILIAIEWVKDDPKGRAFTCAAHFTGQHAGNVKCENYAFALPMSLITDLEQRTRHSLASYKAQFDAL